MQAWPSYPTAHDEGPVVANIKPMSFSLMFQALCNQTSRHLPMDCTPAVLLGALGSLPGPQTPVPTGARQVTGDKENGLDGGGRCGTWLLNGWCISGILDSKALSPPPPSLIVYFLALEVDCTFFKDSVQASAGGPDRTRLRTGCGPQGASLQPSHLFSQTATFTVSCIGPSHFCLSDFA